ncbi:MAG: hypothetical protein HY699_16830 [Deltaproteobacteria bacterium]|nr:hypothetical protein [Deltaproteobacteria bacterium]
MWFLVRFLAAAAALFALWLAGGAAMYSHMVLFCVRAVAALSAGLSVEVSSQAGHVTAVFIAGTRRLAMPLNLRESLAGVVPFIALVMASSGPPLLARLRAALTGMGIIYAVDVAVVSASPLMLESRTGVTKALADVLSVFVMLAGLVALPFFLWLVLLGTGPLPRDREAGRR